MLCPACGHLIGAHGHVWASRAGCTCACCLDLRGPYASPLTRGEGLQVPARDAPEADATVDTGDFGPE